MGRSKKKGSNRGGPVQRAKAAAPARNNHNGQAALISEEIIEAWSGPLPHPDMLKKYDDFMPGAAEAIVKNYLANDEFMRSETSTQSTHRRGIESIFIHGNERRYNIGQFLAASITAGAIIGGIYLVLAGHDTAGAAIATAALGGSVLVYVAGRDATKNQKSRKAD
jgi:uncharacterized membrane protein